MANEQKKLLGYIRDIKEMCDEIYQDENLTKKAVEIEKYLERELYGE